jgi:hypothetical protein
MLSWELDLLFMIFHLVGSAVSYLVERKLACLHSRYLDVAVLASKIVALSVLARDSIFRTA